MNAFKQKSARMGATTHKKMYRAGKMWIYAGITLLGMTEVALNHQVVKADTSAPTTSTTTTASSATTAHVTDSSVKLATSTKTSISAADLLKLLPAGSTLTTTDSQYVFDLPATADATAVKALVGRYSLDKGVQLKFKLADAGTETSTTGYENVDKIINVYNAYAAKYAGTSLASEPDMIELGRLVDNMEKSVGNTTLDWDTINVNLQIAAGTLVEQSGTAADTLSTAKTAVTSSLTFVTGALPSSVVNLVSDPLDDAKTAANSALDDTETTPVSNEKAVSDAKQALQDAINNATDAGALNTAVTTYQTAVQKAKEARTAVVGTNGDVTGSGPETIKAAQAVYPDSQLVSKAISDYNDLVTKANAEEATTQQLSDAVQAITDATTAVKSATEASDVVTPVSNEQSVKDAATAFKAAINAATSTDDLNTAADTYDAAVNAAKDSRDQAILIGTDAITAATTAKVTDNAAVISATKEYNDTVAAANAETGDGSKTTTDIQAAAEKLAAVVNAVTQTNPKTNVDNEPAVVDGKTTLDTVLSNPSSTPQEISDALQTYTATVSQTQDARQKAIDEGDVVVNSAAESSSPEVAQAISEYNQTVAASKNGLATTQSVIDAAGKVSEALQAAIDADNKIADAATTSSPYAKEPDVATALTAIENLKPDATTAEKQAVINDLNTAVTNATT